MKFSAQKDNRKRFMYNKYQVEKSVIKVLCIEAKNKILYSNQHLQKFTSKQRIMNRCSITSRSKGVLKFFKLSRLTFKNKASFGYIEGIRKSSW